MRGACAVGISTHAAVVSIHCATDLSNNINTTCFGKYSAPPVRLASTGQWNFKVKFGIRHWNICWSVRPAARWRGGEHGEECRRGLAGGTAAATTTAGGAVVWGSGGKRRAARRSAQVCASARVVVWRGSSRRAPSVGGGESRASSRTALSAVIAALLAAHLLLFRLRLSRSRAWRSRRPRAPVFRSSAVSPRAVRLMIASSTLTIPAILPNRVVVVQAVTPASRLAAACCDSEIVSLSEPCGCAVMDE